MAIRPYSAEGPVGGPLTLTLESRAGQSKDRPEFGGPSLLHKGNIREGSTSVVIKAAGDETGQAWETTATLWRAGMAKLLVGLSHVTAPRGRSDGIASQDLSGCYRWLKSEESSGCCTH